MRIGSIHFADHTVARARVTRSRQQQGTREQPVSGAFGVYGECDALLPARSP